MSEQKYKSLACIWTIIYILLQVYNVFSVSLPKAATTTMIIAVYFNSLVTLAFSIAYIFLTLSKKIPGPVFGIVIGALSLYPIAFIKTTGFSLAGIIPVILGIAFISSNISMLFYLEKEEHELNMKKAKKVQSTTKNSKKVVA